MVHWTLTVDDRRTGWLDGHTHGRWRETWLHALARYRLAVPVYCLMPDHAHALVVGLEEQSDQLRALSFLRRHTAGMFAGRTEREAVPLRRSGSASLPHWGGWQKQAYDHVLRGYERGYSAFNSVAHYIVENPVRAGLVDRAAAWNFSGSLISGWPDLDWRRKDFWEKWWQIFAKTAGSGTGSRSATTP